MWPSPRGTRTESIILMCSASCGRAACWQTWKGTRSPQMPIVLPMNCTIPLSLNAMFDYQTPGNATETEFSYPAKKNNSALTDREENITAVSFCLTSSEWQSLAAEYEYREEWRIPALYSWQLHLDTEDRSLYYNIKSSQILFPFSLTCLLLIVTFPNLKTKGFFLLKFMGRTEQGREQFLVFFPLLLSALGTGEELWPLSQCSETPWPTYWKTSAFPVCEL